MLGGPFFSSLGKEWDKFGCAQSDSPSFPSSLSTFTHTQTALTSVHLSRQAGLDSGDLMSCPCPVKALAGWAWAPPPQEDGHCMTASRQVAPPLEGPALSSLPGVAGSWNGSLQLAPAPPQWPAVSKMVRRDSDSHWSVIRQGERRDRAP